VWTGITDDPRNTDNAWIESKAFSIHDDTGSGMRAGTRAVVLATHLFPVIGVKTNGE